MRILPQRPQVHQSTATGRRHRQVDGPLSRRRCSPAFERRLFCAISARWLGAITGRNLDRVQPERHARRDQRPDQRRIERSHRVPENVMKLRIWFATLALAHYGLHGRRPGHAAVSAGRTSPPRTACPITTSSVFWSTETASGPELKMDWAFTRTERGRSFGPTRARRNKAWRIRPCFRSRSTSALGTCGSEPWADSAAYRRDASIPSHNSTPV